MHQFFIKNIILVSFACFSLSAISQESGTFKVAKKSGKNYNKGFGIGYEYYLARKNISQLFSFKRQPIEDSKIGHGVYVTHFNYFKPRKMGYYIDGGFVFWNKQKINDNQTIKQRSEILQFTGSYYVSKEIAIIGRLGGLLNHQTDIQKVGSKTTEIKTSNFDLTTGLGISYHHGLLNAKFLISRVNNYYTWSGTVYIPFFFLK